MNNESLYFRKCRELIEDKLSWGSSEHWQTADFEKLGERIFEQTQILISVSTLKRFWGKVKYDSSPNVNTLDALARFIGYENWRVFTSKPIQPQPGTLAEKQVKSTNRKYWILGAVLVVASLIFFSLIEKKTKHLKYNGIVFKSKPVTTGVPNTVVFVYDATQSNADSVFIQQSWNRQLRFKADKDLHEFTTTYYQPGYFRAKLILNDTIVREHDLFIESGGWLGLIERKEVPLYFSQSTITKQDGIGVTAKDVIAKGIDLNKDVPWVSFFDVEKKNVIRANNFVMEAELKNDFTEGSGVCQKTYIVLLCTNGFIAVPLCKKGCVGEMNLFLGMNKIEGKTHDLSAFGVDFTDPVKVRVELKDQKLKILINEHPAYESDFKANLGQIVGKQVRFTGAGTIKRFELNPLD